ncbi:MAG: helix-turn-helix domain-containing protein [Actinomycetota bacterium]|nr:helix-turn-helix domain-containing protein [Actinomycetota bacterium]
MTGPDQGRQSFAGKLAYLIETVHPPDRGSYSYREIAAGIAEHPGAMTAAHINQLVSGKQPHPRIHYVEALASFFGVPVTYFFDDDAAARINDQINQVSAWRDTEARHIAERVVELDPRDRNTVTNLIDSLRTYDEQPRTTRRRRKPTTGNDA